MLGPVTVETPAGSSDGTLFAPRDRVVLSVLAMRRGEIVPAEVLADALWGDQPPTTWPKVVQGLALGIIAYTEDGTGLITIGSYRANPAGGSDIHLLRDRTLLPRRSSADAHEASVRTAALSPDGTRLATGGSEGMLRIWDTETLGMVDEIVFRTPVHGLGWLDADDIVVTLGNGPVLTVTTDPERLVETVRRFLTRGLSAAECLRHGFDDCPPRGHLQGLEARDDAARLSGTYVVSWTSEELADAMRQTWEDSLGTRVDRRSTGLLESRAAAAAGDYALEFGAGGYEIRRSGVDDVVCAGTYDVEDDVLRLWAERGASCPGYEYLEAHYRLADDQLSLAAEDFRGGTTERHLFTSRPLVRQD